MIKDEDDDLDVPRRRPRNDSDDEDLDVPRRRPTTVMHEEATAPPQPPQIQQQQPVVVSLRKPVVLARDKKKESDVVKVTDMPWAKGLAQQREKEAINRQMLREQELPFARTADDPEVDNIYKDQIREEDPMAQFILNEKREKEEKKRRKEARRKRKEKKRRRKMGETVSSSDEEEPVQKKPRWSGRFPPNRYGIKPGHLWDGVDRSNGFEKLLFAQMQKDQSRSEEAYKWSTEDM